MRLGLPPVFEPTRFRGRRSPFATNPARGFQGLAGPVVLRLTAVDEDGRHVAAWMELNGPTPQVRDCPARPLGRPGQSATRPEPEGGSVSRGRGNAPLRSQRPGSLVDPGPEDRLAIGFDFAVTPTRSLLEVQFLIDLTPIAALASFPRFWLGSSVGNSAGWLGSATEGRRPQSAEAGALGARPGRGTQPQPPTICHPSWPDLEPGQNPPPFRLDASSVGTADNGPRPAAPPAAHLRASSLGLGPRQQTPERNTARALGSISRAVRAFSASTPCSV